jgi:SAM-dependent methyltransferase
MLRAPLPLIHNGRERPLPPCDGVKLLMGGAGGLIPTGFFNVDYEAVAGVDVAADVQALPFRDNSVAAIECDAVLEHVQDPSKAVTEMARVLRPGGFLHVVVPFCQPFHGYPSDYHRWTTEGLAGLLETAELSVVDCGVRTGPTATMLVFFCEYCRLLVPASMGRIAYAVANWIVWPLRYLDLWLNRRPNAHVLANHLYILSEKKPC